MSKEKSKYTCKKEKSIFDNGDFGHDPNDPRERRSISSLFYT
jgi:hypothetical protein